jgi:hypothetical protein
MSNAIERISAKLTNLVARRFPAVGRHATASHVETYRSSGGTKRNTLLGRPVFLLDVIGRSTGASRPVMLMYGFDLYQTFTERTIPVAVLTPTDS